MGTSEFRDAARLDRGATMVEYSILVALIAVALVGAVLLFSDGVKGMFDDAATSMSQAAG